MKPIHYIAIGCLLATLIACAFMIGRCTAPREPVEPLSRDTVVVSHIDTIVLEKPVYYAKKVVDTLRIPVPVHDTLRQRDTLWMELPREQKAYRDSSYEAWVSGVQPALDSIWIYAPVQIITVTEKVPVTKRTCWGIGVQAGYGATLHDKTVQLSPYIGIGVSYNILSF